MKKIRFSLLAALAAMMTFGLSSCQDLDIQYNFWLIS